MNPAEKTIVIWDNGASNLSYFVLEGDYSHLDKVYISMSKEEKELHTLVLGRFSMLAHFPTDVIRGNPVVYVIAAGIAL